MTINCVSMRNHAVRGKFHQVSSAMRASSGLCLAMFYPCLGKDLCRL